MQKSKLSARARSCQNFDIFNTRIIGSVGIWREKGGVFVCACVCDGSTSFLEVEAEAVGKDFLSYSWKKGYQGKSCDVIN